YIQTKHPMQVAPVAGMPTFVGSEACKSCHKSEYKVWEKSGHSHAHDTLVKQAKHPSLRQYDPECIVCHTVGFGYQSGFVNEDKTPKLKNVGCESCHGPGSDHIKAEKEAHDNAADWYKVMNPWKAP